MQILVVVANIQWRTLKAEVEKVSVSTAVDMGQSVLRQGVIARLKAAMTFGLCGFAERESVNIPLPECRELKW